MESAFFLHYRTREQIRNFVIGNLIRLQLKLEFVCNSCNAFGIRGFPKENVGATIGRPLAVFIIRSWRALNEHPYKVNQKFATSEDFS